MTYQTTAKGTRRSAAKSSTAKAATEENSAINRVVLDLATQLEERGRELAINRYDMIRRQFSSILQAAWGRTDQATLMKIGVEILQGLPVSDEGVLAEVRQLNMDMVPATRTGLAPRP